MAKELLGSLELNRIYQRDCLSDGGMALIPDKSIDMILCDLPYGTTACKWDTIIPFDRLWAQYERVIKDNGAIVLTASQPFTSALVMSNAKLFKYELIWDKKFTSDFLHAKRRPMKYHENVCIFYKKPPTYNPQKWKGKPNHSMGNVGENPIYRENQNTVLKNVESDKSGLKYPRSIVEFQKHTSTENLHPTQKPASLFEYLIKTYSNEGDIVLDNCMGSGTTAVAAINTNRKFIGFETEPAYIEIANKRIDDLP
jgi:site-specific DNA-methyltransferase (adenine-specific)